MDYNPGQMVESLTFFEVIKGMQHFFIRFCNTVLTPEW